MYCCNKSLVLFCGVVGKEVLRVDLDGQNLELVVVVVVLGSE